MEESTEKRPLIYGQIAKIMADISPVGKGQYNPAQKFKFRGIDDIYNALHHVMASHGVFTIPIIVGRERTQIQSRSGSTMWHVVTQFKFRFYAEDGSYVEAEADGEALDTGDKASNKAASAAHKYALLQTFCIPTENIDEADRHSPEIANHARNPVEKAFTSPSAPSPTTTKNNRGEKMLAAFHALAKQQEKPYLPSEIKQGLERFVQKPLASFENTDFDTVNSIFGEIRESSSAWKDLIPPNPAAAIDKAFQS